MSARYPIFLRVVTVGAALWAVDATCAHSASAQRDAPVIELDPFDLVGRARGPGAFYVLNRGEAPTEVRETRASFVPEIVASVRRKPF